MVALCTGAGSSQLEGSFVAGRAAAEQAVAGVTGAAPALVLVYASLRYDLAALLAGVRSVTGGCPLVGSTSSGQFVDGETVLPGQGVSVLVLPEEPYRFGVASTGGLRERPFAAGRSLARAAIAAVGPHRPRYGALMLLADGLAGDLQSLLNGIYQVAGATVPVVGGAASADLRRHRTYVLHDDRVLDDSAVAVWIGSEHPLRVAVGHGWRAHGLPLLVTRVDGPVVYEIAGRPALEVYQERFRNDDTPDDAGIEWWQGFRATRALGLIEPDGTEIIRAAFIDDTEQVRTFTPLPPYCAVRIMTTTPDDLLNVSEQVVADAIGDGPAQLLLAFSCAARMEILQTRAGEEAARLQKAADTVRTFGFYTYGEFARSAGIAGYHNATIAAIAL